MLPTAGQYTAMRDGASAGGDALAAINVTSAQTLNAAMRGFAEAGADGIVRVTVGGARYLSGPAGDAAAGARALAALAAEVARGLPVAVALHTDHCPPEHVDGFLRPLLSASRDWVARGERALFHSHMVDGSTLPLDENLRRSAELLEQRRVLDVVLEVECGAAGGEEDGIGGDDAIGERLYTTPEDLLRVAEALGTGERGRYLLAATFGNVHGLYAPGSVRLRPEILAAGQAALAAGHPGARLRYVFHGSSGSSPEDVRAAVSTPRRSTRSRAPPPGTCSSTTTAVSRSTAASATSAPMTRAAWGARAEAGMAERVAQACELLGSAGRSIAA